MINTDKNHKHIYDAQGKQLCCTQVEKIYEKAGAEELLQEKHHHHDGHNHDHNDDDGHNHDHSNGNPMKMFLPSVISLVLLLVALYLDNYLKPDWFTGWIKIILYVIAYTPVGIPVLKEAFESISKGDIFSEFF